MSERRAPDAGQPNRRVACGALAWFAAIVSLVSLVPLDTARAEEASPATTEVDEALAAEPAEDAESPEPEPAIPDASPLELQAFALVNDARADRGVASLRWDPVMAEVARAHARDMMTRGVVSHAGSDGSFPAQRLRRAGVRFQYGSENIWTYWSRTPEAGPATMHAAMMAEPWAPGLWNHIGNILYAGYRRIGVGMAIAPHGVQYLSEVFAD